MEQKCLVLEDLKKYIQEKPEAFVKAYFKNEFGDPFICTPYQAEFLRDVFNKKNNKYIFCASTRSGKSEIISIAALMLCLFYEGEKVLVISSTYRQAQIIFSRIRAHCYDNKEIFDMIDVKKSFSKEHISFKNGSEAKCLSAGNPEGLLGFGGSVVIVDESGSIDDETYYTKILRMIATGRKKRILIESGTPHRPNHFKETWANPNYKRYHITWRDAVKAGQMSKEEVEQIKERLTDMEFKMWYEAEFPDEGIDQLIGIKDFMTAREKGAKAQEINEENDFYLGVDVARFGRDKTVFTIVEYCKDTREYILRDTIAIDKSDLMEVAGRIVALDFSFKFKEIVIDDTGLGGGVVDRLKEQIIGDKIKAVNFGSKPIGMDADRYLNIKAQIFMNMADIFKKHQIALTPNRYSKVQGDELLWMRYTFTSNGKIKIVDPGEKGEDGIVVGTKKSPDFADSLALALFRQKTGEMSILSDPDNITGLFG